MRLIRMTLCAMAALLVLSSAALAEDWKPISPEELQLKEVPGAKGAHAAILYFEDIMNDKDCTESVYFRLKILSEEGKKYADIESPRFRKEVQINSFKARTIQPDGTIVPFDGKVFTKIVEKKRESTIYVKSFSIPDVRVGSIIEYRFIMSWERHHYFESEYVRLQQELFTRKAHVVVIPEPDLAYSYVTFNMPQNFRPVQTPRDITLDAQDLPALEREDFMPPMDELRARLVIFKRQNNFSEMDKFWKEEGKNWRNSTEKFLDRKGAMTSEVSGLLNGASSAEEKLRRIYARVQKIENVDYAPEKTEKEQQKEKRKVNNNVEDVLRNGYGSHGQINRLFVALARAAGFEAYAVLVTERDGAVFHKNILSMKQLDGEIALVKLDGKDAYFSPATPYCSFGFLPWQDTLVDGMRADKDGASFLMTPIPLAADTVRHRKADLKLTDDGSLTGELVVTFTGTEALRRRLAEREHDDVERKKNIEEQIKDWLPTAGSTAELVSVEKWESNEPLVVKAKIAIPGYATSMGKRVLMPAFAFHTSKGHSFQSSRRTQPVYFHSPWTDEDEVTITMPEGMQVESLPAKREFKNGPAAYSTELTRNGSVLKLQRRFVMDNVLFDVKYYQALQQVFDAVKAGDDEQAVLRFTSVSAAAK